MSIGKVNCQLPFKSDGTQLAAPKVGVAVSVASNEIDNPIKIFKCFMKCYSAESMSYAVRDFFAQRRFICVGA